MGLLDKFKKRLFEKEAQSKNVTQSDIMLSEPTGELHTLIDSLINASDRVYQYTVVTLGDSQEGKDILALDADASAEMIMSCLTRYLETEKAVKKIMKQNRYSGYGQENDWVIKRYVVEKSIIKSLIRRKLSFTTAQVKALLHWVGYSKDYNHELPIAHIIKTCENYLQNNTLDNEFEKLLQRLIKKINQEKYDEKKNRQQISRINTLLGESEGVSLEPGEAWSDAVIHCISKSNDKSALSQSLTSLLVHCQKNSGSKPTKKWLKEANTHIDNIGKDQLHDWLIKWFALVDKPKTQQIEDTSSWWYDPNAVPNPKNADILKGLVWYCSIAANPDIARALVNVALSSYKKVRGIGPRCSKVGNACIYALATMPGKMGLYQLAVLKIKIKHRGALKMMHKALETAALREGISVDELEEIGVPSYGLDGVGYGEEECGDFHAIIKVLDSKTTELTWRKADGKTQKTVPQVIKNDYQAELKELRGAIKDIKSMVSVQKQRLEMLFLKERSWTFEQWTERYIHHPLVGIVAQNLIWRLTFAEQSILVLYRDNQCVDINGDEVSQLASIERVELWHPISSSIDDIKAWRDKIEQLQIMQPFKQAHREVYLLTDAERHTGVYSNRFASHIIKQHQFNALVKARGWSFSLQGFWDGGTDSIAKLSLERFNLCAEFWVQGAGDTQTDAGLFAYLSTDQVRFYTLKNSLDSVNENNILNDTPTAIADIPPLVLSEVLRDVDLFVGVCSVGNDPEWSDGGPNGHYRDYWHSFSFGDLSASAKTRKALLEKLIPKLSIAKQCKFVDKFLVVEGSRRIYKIHLGSGNILMEPNNQYLCIVADAKKKKASGHVFLPFEGDNTLSVIISKAMLLADDKKIKDATINAQIG